MGASSKNSENLSMSMVADEISNFKSDLEMVVIIYQTDSYGI